jgi:Kef-type K+ transport system membrane component KefB
MPLNDSGARRTAIILTTAAACFVSVILILFALIATQGMSGKESVSSLTSFFSPFFAVAIGLPAVCTTIFTSKGRAWRVACAYTAGGAVGGTLMAFAVNGLTRYDHELRILTGGGPTGKFLLWAVPVSVIFAIAVGTLLRKFAFNGAGSS